MPCDAATPDSCRFKGNVHGSQEEVILEAEDISYKKNQRREELRAKKALEKAEQQQQKEAADTVSPAPAKPVPKPAAPKPTPVPKPPAKPAAPAKPKPKVKLGHTLAEGISASQALTGAPTSSQHPAHKSHRQKKNT